MSDRKNYFDRGKRHRLPAFGMSPELRESFEEHRGQEAQLKELEEQRREIRKLRRERDDLRDQLAARNESLLKCISSALKGFFGR